MTHQEAIEKILYEILNLEDSIIEAFCRGNPFDKFLRSYDEFNSQGERLYRNKRGWHHYKISKNAYNSGLNAVQLYGEHRIPLNLVIKELLESDRSLKSIERILRSNEVVLITQEEQKLLDTAIEKGGLGLRSKMPKDGSDRLEYAGIEIAPETSANTLNV